MKRNISLLISIGISAVAIFLVLSSQTTTEDTQPLVEVTPAEPLAIMGDNEILNRETPEQPVQRDIASKIEESQKSGGALDEWLSSMKQTDFKFQTTRDGERILTVLGGNFKDVGKDENTAFDFLSEFANRVGVDASQLDKNSLFKHQTIRKQIYGFEQVFGGLPVFDSFVKVETKRDDNSAYMILNNLKIIPEGAVVPEVAVDMEKAKENALATLSDEFTNATPTEEPLVIWAQSGDSIDLAWSLLLQGEHISEFVLVSATTGQILANYKAQSHQAH